MTASLSAIDFSRASIFLHRAFSVMSLRFGSKMPAAPSNNSLRHANIWFGCTLYSQATSDIFFPSKLGINAVFPKKHLSIPDKQHPKYPYLLHNVAITRVNQVWSTDITYIRLKGGFVYLTAVIDWYSRCVLSRKLSTTLNAQFCIDAVREALDKYGWPEIFNTDQGCQYTSKDFTAIFENSPTRLSMDGKGRAFDNIFVERLWRTVKYEDVYIRGYQSVKECKAGLERYFTFYNDRREHSSLDGNTPSDIYFRRTFIEGAA